MSFIEGGDVRPVERLGGIGARVCEGLRDETGKETRSVVLGHLQRGGTPTSFDRVLATRFGGKAVELVKRGEFGRMVAFAPPDIVAVPAGRRRGQDEEGAARLRSAADCEGDGRHVWRSGMN